MIKFEKVLMPLCANGMHEDCPRLEAAGGGTTSGTRCTCGCHYRRARPELLRSLSEHIASQDK